MKTEGEWFMRNVGMSVFLATTIMALPAQAQVPAEVEACRLAGLVALKERSPAIKDLTFDIDGLAISKANTKVEDTPVKMVIMGDAYLQREKTDQPNRFVCPIGETSKVLLTFFTEQ
jgi:galactitol-specific phosphotransferase system IIB component